MKKQGIPKMFRSPVPPKKFQKKILRRIHAEAERNFLLSKVHQDDEGKYRLSEELSKDDLKHLKRLAKSIKKNRGLLTAWKFVILVIIIAAVLVFNIIFKNRLIEQAAEKSLETVFNARVEMYGTDLSILKGSLGFTHLKIADEGRPMRNLIEMGRTNLSIDMARLMSRRFVINEVVCREIEFNTQRETSGALPASAGENTGDRENASETLEKAAAEAGDFGMELAADSADKLIKKYEESLSSPEMLSSAQGLYTEIEERWTARIEASQKQLSLLEKQAQELLARDPASINTIAKAEEYLGKLEKLEASAAEVQSNIDGAYTEYKEDIDGIEETKRAIDRAIGEDIDFLTQAVDTFVSDTGGIIAETAEPLIRERLGDLYRYGEKIVRIYNRLQENSTEKKSRFSDRGREGTTVSFPRQTYPQFLIKSIEVSAGQEEAVGFTEFQVKDLTGNQETWGKPTTAFFRTKGGFQSSGEELSSNLSIDGRSSADYLLESETVLKTFLLDLSEGLEGLSIQSLNAVSNSHFEFNLNSDLSGIGRADISLRDLGVDFVNNDSLIGSAITDILKDIDEFEFEVILDFTQGTIDTIEVNSDLDELLTARVGDYAKQQAEKTAAEVEEAFYRYLSEELELNEELSRDIKGQGRELAEDLENAESLEDALEARKAEIEKQARAEIDKKTDELKDKAKEGLESLGEQIQIPGF